MSCTRIESESFVYPVRAVHERVAAAFALGAKLRARHNVHDFVLRTHLRRWMTDYLEVRVACDVYCDGDDGARLQGVWSKVRRGVGGGSAATMAQVQVCTTFDRRLIVACALISLVWLR